MNISLFSDQSHVLFYLLLGILLFLIFRLIHYSGAKYFTNRFKKYFVRTFYLIEITSWFIFLFEGIQYFAAKNIFLTAIICIVLLISIIWFCRFIALDFLAGLILKFDDEFKSGELIEFDGISGRITCVSVRLLELEDDSGRKINIPFHHFFIKRYFHKGSSDFSFKENFILKLKDSSKPIELIDEIRLYVKQLPWTNMNYEPEVKIDRFDENTISIQIVASLFNEKYKENFRFMLRNRFE